MLGREWQLSTIQVDFIQPARLGCEYIGEDGTAHTPVLLHRAVTGSTERFYGVLIEQFAGAFPVVAGAGAGRRSSRSPTGTPSTPSQVSEQLKAAGLRVEVDASSERMNDKIRQAQLQKVPYMLVIGDKEQEAGAVAVRLRSGTDLGALPVAEVQARLVRETQARKDEE